MRAGKEPAKELIYLIGLEHGSSRYLVRATSALKSTDKITVLFDFDPRILMNNMYRV